MSISISTAKYPREAALAALADPTRARIVEMLATRPHAASELHRAFPIAAPAVSRHLRVLREAGLVAERRPEDDRRVRVYSLRTEQVQELADWLGGVTQTWQNQLVSFKDYVALRTGRPERGA